MNKISILTGVLLLMIQNVYAQVAVTGLITDGTNKKPVKGATLYARKSHVSTATKPVRC